MYVGSLFFPEPRHQKIAILQRAYLKDAGGAESLKVYIYLTLEALKQHQKQYSTTTATKRPIKTLDEQYTA